MMKSNYNICYCYPLRGSARWKKNWQQKHEILNIQQNWHIFIRVKNELQKWESEKRDERWIVAILSSKWA